MATQINKFSVTQLTLAAHVRFHTVVNNAIAAYSADKLHLATLVPRYADAVAAERAVLNRPTAFSETPYIEKVDLQRNHAISLAFKLVNAFLKSTDTAEITAAQHLHAIIAPFKSIKKHEYNRKTMEIDRLIVAFSTAEPAHIALLALASPIKQLTAHNIAFDALKAARSADLVIRTPITIANTATLRLATDALYREMVQTVNAFTIVDPSAELEKFATNVNALISQYKLVVANQGKSKREPSE